MPIQTIKDPQTGEERMVYVAPKGMGPKPQQQRPQRAPGLGDTLVGQFANTLLGSTVASERQFQAEMRRTGDVQKARAAAQQAGVQQLQGPGAGREIARVGTAGMLRTAQGVSDLVTNAAAAVGLAEPTSIERPNAPFLGVLPALPEIKQNQGERFITDIVTFGVQMLGFGGPAAKLAGGALAAKVPQAARLSRSTTAGIQALKTAPVRGGGVAAGTKGLAQRALGITAEGALVGAPASAITTFTFGDPHGGSLSDSVYDLVKGTPLDTPVLRYLRSDSRDKGLEAQLKAAINDAVWGAPFGAAFGIAGEGGKQVLKRTSNAIFNTFKAAKKADAAKIADTVEAAAEEAPAAATVDVPVEAVTEPQLPPSPAKRITGRRASQVYAEMRREPLWEQKSPEFQQRLELDKPADQVLPEAPAKAAEPVEIQPIADPVADAELANKELLRSHQDLQTEVAKTIHTAEQPALLSEGQIPELAAPVYREVETVPIETIARDPKRFQYKAAGQTKTGRSGSLVDTEAYNPDLAGVLTVWRDPADGKAYIVNGHNRLDLAEKTGFPTVNVRYIQAANAAEARTKGAMQNIAEGQGTPIDAANVMRDGGMSPQEMIAAGVSPRGAVMAQAIPLSRLPKELFDQAVRGDITVDMGVAIGSSNGTEQVMRDLAALAKKGKWSAAKTAEAAEIARFATTTEMRDPNALPLPGFDVMSSSNFSKLLEVRMAVKSLLKQEITALAAAANQGKTGILEAAGNVIDVQSSRMARAAAMQEAEVFGRLANMRGPLSDVLNSIADQITGKRKAADVVAANIDQIRGAIDEEINGPRLQQVAEQPVEEVQPVVAPAPEAAPATTAARLTGMSPEDKRQLDQALKMLPVERREEVIRQLQGQGKVVSNPNPIGEEPVIPVAKEEPAAPVTPATFQLPEELAKAANNYSFGSKRFTIEFANDLDRTAYYLAGDITGKPSRSAAKYRAALEAAGLDPKQVAEYGAAVVKPRIKDVAKVSPSGTVIQLPNQGFGGGDLSVELPPVPKGSLGEDYTGRNVFSDDDRRLLLEEVQRVAGTDVNVQFPETLEGTMTAGQARNYGVQEGTPYQAFGQFVTGETPADDLVMIAMFSRGRMQLFTKQLATAFHESFHRIQNRFLQAGERATLKAGEPEIRKLAAEAVPDLAQRLLNDQHPQYIKRKEAEAMAFSIWWKERDKAPETGWAGVMNKLAKLAEATGNWLKLRGFQTWDDVFERAYSGEMARRTPMLGVEPGPVLAVDPPDPEEFARRVAENLDALRNGDAKLEDLAATAAEDLRVRRIMSPSGQTPYVSMAPDELVAANEALQRAFVERAELTGVPNADISAIFEEAVSRLRREGMDTGVTIQRVNAARQGDLRSKEDLVAQAALIIHRDHVLNQNAITALEYQNAIDDAAKADAMSRLWAGLEDQVRLDVADATISRKDAQRLRLRQGRTVIDPTLNELPRGTVLRHGTDEEAGQAILRDGFVTSPQFQVMGEGVYFTTDGLYSGGYGPVEVYGDLPADVKILDLIAGDRSVADILKGLGAGGLNKEGLMSREQKALFRQWVLDNGYVGVRYDPVLGGRPMDQADEIIIYDVNSANRVVGSDAAIEPEPPEVDPVSKTIREEVENPENTLFNRLPEEVQQSIRDGELTPEAEQLTDTMVQAVIAGRQRPGVTKRFLNNAARVPVGYLTQDAILQLYRGALLWSPKTWYKMFFGSAFRAATLPISQAAGALFDAGVGAAKQDPGAAYRALRRANVSMQVYGQYGARMMNAFRLMGESLKSGESLMNLGRSQFEVAQRGFTADDQLRLEGAQFDEVKRPENNLDSPFFVNPESKNLMAIGVRYLWKTMQVSGRVSSSLDTFYSALVGPSAEWARHMDEYLEKADLKGLQGEDAWDWASSMTDEALDKQLVDVVVNGNRIKDGALVGAHAQNVMDWVNFTDDVMVKFQDRSYEYGIRVARNEGLTEPTEINERALQWMQEGPSGLARIGMGVGNAVSLAPKVFQDAVNNVPLMGMLQPFNRGPANILKSSMRASGLAAPLADTWWRDINSEDMFTRERAIGEMAVGYMTLATGVMMATSGYVQLSGPGSFNPQVRNKMQRSGYQPYSLRIKNPATGEWSGWVSLAPLDMVSNVFATIGGYSEAANNMTLENREVLAGNALLTVAETIRQTGVAQFTKSMYEGITEIADLITEATDKSFVPEKNRISPWTAYVEKKLAGFIPSIARNMRNGFDPYKRLIPASDAPFPFNVFQQTLSRLANQVPGMSESLPPDLHPITGEPITVEQVWGTQFIPPDQPWLRGLVQAFSPTSAFPYREGPRPIVDNELAKLSGRGTTFIVWTPTEFDGVRLSHEQLNGPDGLKALGARIIPPGRNVTLAQSLEDLIVSPEYQALPEPTPSKASESARVMLINDEIEHYKKYAKEAYLQMNPDVDAEIRRVTGIRAGNRYQASYGMPGTQPGSVEDFTRRFN